MSDKEIVECWRWLEKFNKVSGLLIGIYGAFNLEGGVEIKIGPQGIPTNLDMEGSTLLEAVTKLRKKQGFIKNNEEV